MTLGTNRHALVVARRAGYPPPLAWDDEDLDDPHGRPRHDARKDEVVDAVAVEAGASGRHSTLTSRERVGHADHLGSRVQVDPGVDWLWEQRVFG